MSVLREQLICVTGPIGAGKSTLVDALAVVLGATAYRERVEANPAYTRALEDPARWAFEAELGFVLESLENWASARRSGAPAVLERCAADNAAVFGGVRALHGEISQHQLRLLERCAGFAPLLGGTPDLVVLLSCPTPVCRERIQRRGLPAEDRYTEAQLDEIAERYEAWVVGWTASPVVRVDSHANDVRSPAFAGELATKLRIVLDDNAAGRRGAARVVTYGL